MHNYSLFYASTSYEKTSKKSRKNFSEGENQPYSCCEVTFTQLKLLRYPAKVGLLQGKSYSITRQKFIHYTYPLVYSSCKIHLILTHETVNTTFTAL